MTLAESILVRLNPTISRHERYVNLFIKDQDPRLKYVDQVWDMLQAAYKEMGGIKGSGFESKAALVKTMPFWKLSVREGVVTCVIIYKDKSGRKLVAVAVNRDAPTGKVDFENIMRAEFERSYMEVSHHLLSWLEKRVPKLLKKYRIKVSDAKKILKNDTLEPIDDYFYRREIGGDMIRKAMFGTPNKAIT